MSGNGHVPVLLGPVLRGLNIKANGAYVDGTFGRGGHAFAILEQLGADGRLLAMDRDSEAIASAPANRLNDPRFELIKSEIAELEDIIAERGLVGRIDGVLFDLGVSSPQLDEHRRGFSFRHDGPLDMRMDPDDGEPASAWLATVDEKTLTRVIRQFGEEPHAGRVARAIVSARKSAPVERTVRLAEIVEDALPPVHRSRRSRRHPATRTFQAIRMFINDELAQLRAGLEQSIRVLAPGGRLCVITFHSLEDRLVKRFIREASREPEQYRGLPDVPPEFRPTLRAVGKAVVPDAHEVAANARARSARLRIAERL